MSGSNRGDYTKAGLIAGLIVALLFCFGWIGYGLSESDKYERHADNQNREYSEYTSEKVAQTCVGIPRVEKFKCLNEAFEKQREYQANQQDLVAQRQSALWAYVMGAAAVIGMALSAVGVFLVWTTFAETKLANVLVRQAHEMEFRPILTFNRLHIERYGTDDLMLTPVWKNIGKLPAQPTMTKTYRKYDKGNARAVRIEEILAGRPAFSSESRPIVPSDSEHFGPSVLIQASLIGRAGKSSPTDVEWIMGLPKNVADCIFSVEYIAALGQLPGQKWHSQSVRGFSPRFDGDTNVLSGEFAELPPLDYPRDIMT